MWLERAFVEQSEVGLLPSIRMIFSETLDMYPPMHKGAVEQVLAGSPIGGH